MPFFNTILQPLSDHPGTVRSRKLSGGADVRIFRCDTFGLLPLAESIHKRKRKGKRGALCAHRQIHTAHPDMGYRRIRDELAARYGRKVNDKRVLRLCRKLGIQSTVKWRPRGCTRGERSAKYTAENLLAREFHAEKPNEKWVTDVTEFKYYTGTEVHKVYLSAILDLCDRRLVAYKIRNHNDNELVMATIDEAVGERGGSASAGPFGPGVPVHKPSFRKRLEENRMRQSMSRVGRCIDNGPMEGFWGILKREMYYGRRFTTGRIWWGASKNI